MILAKRLEKDGKSIYIHPCQVEKHLANGWVIYGQPKEVDKPIAEKRKRGRPKKILS